MPTPIKAPERVSRSQTPSAGQQSGKAKTALNVAADSEIGVAADPRLVSEPAASKDETHSAAKRATDTADGAALPPTATNEGVLAGHHALDEPHSNGDAEPAMSQAPSGGHQGNADMEAHDSSNAEHEHAPEQPRGTEQAESAALQAQLSQMEAHMKSEQERHEAEVQRLEQLLEEKAGQSSAQEAAIAERDEEIQRLRSQMHTLQAAQEEQTAAASAQWDSMKQRLEEQVATHASVSLKATCEAT